MKKALLPLLLVVPLVACQNNANLPKSFNFELTDLGQDVDFHTEFQQQYINSENYLTTMGIASGSTSKEYPVPVTLSFSGAADNNDAPKY